MNAEQAIALLQKMITIPSFSGQEDKVADLIENTLRDSGFLPQRYGNNVWAVTPNYIEGRPTLLMDAHIDTVRPQKTWTFDPFMPTLHEGKLYGLGSNDTGGSVVSMLATFINMAKVSKSYNLVYLASAEEENSGVNGIQSVIDKLGHVDVALVGEPTGMHPAIAEKGLVVLDCIAHGRSGHAARNEGVNAIYQAMEAINWIQNYSFPKESELLGKVKMTVTGIEAGTLHNVVPATCKFMVDIRVNEHYTNQQVVDMIKENINCEVQPRSFSLNSSYIDKNHPLVERCIALGKIPYGSPTTSNQAVIPYTSLKIGPGDSARSHTADEYICFAEIEEAIEVFKQIVE